MKRIPNTIEALRSLPKMCVIQADLETPGREGHGVVYHRYDDDEWSTPGIAHTVTLDHIAKHTVKYWIVLFPFEETDVEVRLREQEEQLLNQQTQIEALTRRLEEVIVYLESTVTPMVAAYRQTLITTSSTARLSASTHTNTNIP